MQAVTYIKENAYNFGYEALQTAKQFRLGFVTDTLKDYGHIIKHKTSNKQLEEIQARSQIVRASVAALAISVATLAIGTLLGSSFLVAVGSFGKDASLIAGFIGLAGMNANEIIEAYEIEGNDLDDEGEEMYDMQPSSQQRQYAPQATSYSTSSSRYVAVDSEDY